MGYARKMIRRWRLGVVRDPKSGEEAGIYVCRHSGQFYAFVPEVEGGDLLESSSMDDLQKQVWRKLRESVEGRTEWEEVIEIDYVGPRSWELAAVGNSRISQGKTWSPDDAATAGECIGPLLVRRLRRAVIVGGGESPTGSERRALFTRWGGGEVWSEWLGGNAGRKVYHPYSDEEYFRLLDLRDRIQEADHQIRRFLRDPTLSPPSLVTVG